jgi:hypothetical protein
MPIFVSHSTKPENTRAAKALDLVHREITSFRRRHGDIKTFLDREMLGPGDNFSARIIKALAETTLAIILVSEEALERSSWVHFEAGVIYWRRHFDPKIHLLYVLIGVDRETCRKTFSPMQPEQFLDVVYDEGDEAAFLSQIRDFLKRHVDATHALLDDPAYRGPAEFLQAQCSRGRLAEHVRSSDGPAHNGAGRRANDRRVLKLPRAYHQCREQTSASRSPQKADNPPLVREQASHRLHLRYRRARQSTKRCPGCGHVAPAGRASPCAGLPAQG